jgi:hypothetical protein
VLFSSAGPRKYGCYFRRPRDRRKCSVFLWAGVYFRGQAHENTEVIFVGLWTDENTKLFSWAGINAPIHSLGAARAFLLLLGCQRRAATQASLLLGRQQPAPNKLHPPLRIFDCHRPGNESSTPESVSESRICPCASLLDRLLHDPADWWFWFVGVLHPVNLRLPPPQFIPLTSREHQNLRWPDLRPLCLARTLWTSGLSVTRENILTIYSYFVKP